MDILVFFILVIMFVLIINRFIRYKSLYPEELPYSKIISFDKFVYYDNEQFIYLRASRPVASNLTMKVQVRFDSMAEIDLVIIIPKGEIDTISLFPDSICDNSQLVHCTISEVIKEVKDLYDYRDGKTY